MQTLYNFPAPVLAEPLNERRADVCGNANTELSVNTGEARESTKSVTPVMAEKLPRDSRGGENLWSGPVFLVFSAGLGPFSAAASEQLVVPRRGGKNPGACCRKSRRPAA